MKKWEYLCQRLTYDQPDLEKHLDEFGEKGWELVGIANVQVGFSASKRAHILFFKREREVPADQLNSPTQIDELTKLEVLLNSSTKPSAGGPS